MPQSLSLINGQSFTIPEKVATLSIQMWAAGGGGENVSDSFVRTPGGNGGNTELLGLRAIGGVGGSTSGGGGGGSGTTTFDWSSLGVTASTYNGTNGVITSAGNGALIGSTRYGNGASGDPGTTTYTSSVTHVFNNITDTHIFSSTSPDLSVSFENRTAADGLSCSPNYSTKHYRIIFNNSFIDSGYSISVYGICQQAAGGGITPPFYSGGILDKTSSGFRIWFCNGDAKNGYVRCFSFQTVGQKADAQGMGGGGGGGVSAFFTRENLIASSSYAPGTTHTAIVGSGGSGYGTGGNGRINIQMLIVPTINLSVSNTSINLGQCVTLSWETTGDGDTITWLSGGITNGNLTSSQTVCPEETTTYSVQASGDGGTSEISSLTVIVYYAATANITSTEQINYGDTLYVSYETQYADQSITITPYYYFVDGTSLVGDDISITPALTAESLKPDSETIVSDTQLEIPVPWNTVGPESVQVVINAIGTGGTAISSSSTSVYIDITPNNINVDETPDVIKDQDPVYTVNVPPEELVLSDLYYIDGIDIPVEVKSDFPIQVEINQSGEWKNIREI
jgi:hypothetical protein